METKPGNLTGMFYPLCDMLEAWGMSYESRETAPANIKVNGHTIWFASADKSEKMKYFDNIDLVIINEATALHEDDFQQLMNRMGRTAPAEIIFTFNPIDQDHWLVKRYVTPFLEGKLGENIAVHHSTYHDNKYAAAEYCQWAESMMELDPNFYRVYALGQPGHLEGLIYLEGANWVHQPLSEWPREQQVAPPKSIGIDFGFTNPSVIVGVWETPAGRYVHQFLYASGMTHDELVRALTDLITKAGWRQLRIPIICDSAEPARIEDMVRKGFNALPAMKDIRFGIDIIKVKKLVVSDESLDGIKELRNYRWKDKKGIMKDEPLDAFNHFCDALRYAVATTIERPTNWRLKIQPQSTYQSPYHVR
jgi:phage terminase large subunit